MLYAILMVYGVTELNPKLISTIFNSFFCGTQTTDPTNLIYCFSPFPNAKWEEIPHRYFDFMCHITQHENKISLKTIWNWKVSTCWSQHWHLLHWHTYRKLSSQLRISIRVWSLDYLYLWPGLLSEHLFYSRWGCLW